MESTFKPASLLSHALLLFLICFSPFLPSAKPISDYTTLLYKNCANDQTLSSPTKSHSQTLSNLFQELVSHSFHSKFFKTIESDDGTAILGLFQCRGDISNEDCRHCVNVLPHVSSNFCKESMAARVHLYGCYMWYKPEGVSEASSKHELVYKSCVEPKQVVVAGTFEEMRGRAFAALESGIANGSRDGFYETRYESMDVMGQCEGDLEGCECEECVNTAVQIADKECGRTVSGQIYLKKCFLSFSYHPKEKVRNNNNNNNNNNKRTVAIVVGVAAALSLGFLLVLFIKSWTKKDED
ncbi:hypothetical protein FNV43_RR02802 [Rhamnella rubrinervis]|uniref:Gnk2-homologous domain-containing protein n=1 Tax=Rhamnella rubrinervis TaxID=2594499 RepID=A0A8K0HIJ9_9ROSA|nr:hypothetical protein FNV43_RR02802 [Rhamnella rubrinervis]